MRPEFLPPSRGSIGSCDRIIISCDIGNHYADEFTVTKRNCDLYCGDAWRLYYSDYPDGCPPHRERQYAFKIYAMEEAIKVGFRYVLWIDSSLAPLAPITPLWRRIAQAGWYAAPQYNGITCGNGWRHWASTVQATLGEWCSDSALKTFGITREMALSIPLALTGLVGLDMGNPVGERIWEKHREFYKLGVFNGPHANRPGEKVVEVGNGKFQGHVSDDSSVLGHRHDETSLSFILNSLGLKPVNLGFWTLESESGFIGQFTHRYGIKYKGPTP